MGAWTAKEIQRLKQYFLESKTLREMSALLGRSVTGVNKSLTRFKIRQHTPLRARPLEKYTLNESRKALQVIHWHNQPKCDMQDVYDFVAKCMKGRLSFHHGRWIYRGSYIEQRRAFILINMERDLRKLPVFYFNYDAQDG